MSIELKLFHIQALHDTLQEVSNDWLTNAFQATVCSACYSPYASTTTLDIQIEGAMEDVPLNVVTPIGIGLIRLDLLSSLGEIEFQKDFFLGSVFSASGQAIDDFFTFRGKSQAIIRGGPRSSHRICESCKRQWYHPIGKRYVLASSLDDRLFHESQFGQIIACENVVSGLLGDSWDRIDISPLTVLTNSRDDIKLDCD